MTMMEYFEKGYTVIVGSMWGDVVCKDADMVECYEEDSHFVKVDEDAKVAYFYEDDDEVYDE